MMAVSVVMMVNGSDVAHPRALLQIDVALMIIAGFQAEERWERKREGALSINLDLRVINTLYDGDCILAI
jgi:hypothetical protein